MSEGIKAVLLVGGKGTRLRPVFSSGPKPLATVGERSFLDLLVRQLRNQGVRRLVMCTGYMAGQIENEFGDGRTRDMVIEYSKETEPLGTAGALRLAERYLDAVEDFIVMNGDSFVEIDLPEFVHFHHKKNGTATLAVWKAANSARYGTVEIGSDCRVTGFREKAGNDSPGLINAGVYVFSHSIFKRIPEGNVSLEQDIFPRLLDDGIYAQEQHGTFIDIGTPEDYARAQKIYDQLKQAAVPGPRFEDVESVPYQTPRREQG